MVLLFCLLLSLVESFAYHHLLFFFFFNDTATTEIYTLSLHDALPISPPCWVNVTPKKLTNSKEERSEEHTSELQSHSDIVCRLLLEKKKKNISGRKTKNEKAKKETKENWHTQH